MGEASESCICDEGSSGVTIAVLMDYAAGSAWAGDPFGITKFESAIVNVRGRSEPRPARTPIR